MDNFIINASIIQNANPCEGVVNWTASTPPSNSWYDIAWASSLGLFVALKQNSSATPVMTSPDGITWTSRSAPTTGFPFWTSLAWSPTLNLFVAVAASGSSRVMTSPDGINWTLRNASNASTWNCVEWIPTLNLFVAGANAWGVNVNIMTSPDGINWTTRNSPSFQSKGFAWSQSLGLIVAVADTSPKILTSPDGINWTSRTVTGVPQFSDVVWSPSLGLFVAVSRVDALLARSSDGINWTSYNASFPHGISDFMTSIAWAPEISTFVMIGYDSGTGKVVFSSKDALTWTERTCPNPTNSWNKIAWSPALGIFAAVAGGGTNLAMVSNKCP